MSDHRALSPLQPDNSDCSTSIISRSHPMEVHAGRPKSAQHLARASDEPCSTIVRGATFCERLTDEAMHARQRHASAGAPWLVVRLNVDFDIHREPGGRVHLPESRPDRSAIGAHQFEAVTERVSHMGPT